MSYHGPELQSDAVDEFYEREILGNTTETTENVPEKTDAATIIVPGATYRNDSNFPTGTRIHYVEVLGPRPQKQEAMKPRKGSEHSKPVHYQVRCLAPKRRPAPNQFRESPDEICGKVFETTYAKLYYQKVFSCGCRTWPKHPAISLEGHTFEDGIHPVEVLRWATEEPKGYWYKGAWEAICHDCGTVMYRVHAKEIRGLSDLPCLQHTPYLL